MKKIISLLITTTMFVSTIPISFAETNTSNNIENESEVLFSENNLPMDDEPVNFEGSFAANNDTADDEVAENIVPGEERLENIASGGVVLTPDESVLNDPVMTPENRAKLEAYEARLMKEMEEEGYNINSDISLAASTIPTFNQYLADYNYNFNCYSFYKNDFKLPYRSFVETKRDSAAYQTLLGAWRVATFSLSDITEYSSKEIGFYETILFDVLYQGKDVESISGMMKDCVDTVEASSFKKISKFLAEDFDNMFYQNITDMDANQLEQINNACQSCEELEDVFSAIGNISKALGYVDNVEELIYKLAKAQVIAENANETAKILLTMKNHTSNLAMQKALDNMILICSDMVSESTVIYVFSSDMVISELFNYVLDEVWDDVLSHLNLYGLAVSAGQAAGKLLTGWLFSTDESVEMYYSACALYEFEDTLKIAMNTYEKNYNSSHSDANSKVFNECYRLLLRTYLYGSKTSQKFVDIEYKCGAINQLLLYFKESEYEEYSKKLKNITTSVELTIEFMDTVAYNGYLEEYCNDSAPLVGVVTKPDNYTPDEKQSTIDLLNILSLETNNLVITKDMTLTSNLHTYGSILQKRGTLYINGHTLKIDGDYIIADIGKDSNGDPVYQGTSLATLNMTNENDKVTVSGNFKTYGQSVLTAGTMEIRGDFEQYDYSPYAGGGASFNAKEKHKVIFNGDGTQTISFASTSSGFKNVEFKNNKIKINSRIRGFALTQDTILSETTELGISGTLDLNGHVLTMPKGLLQTYGTINLNNGTLEIDGDYIIADIGKDSNGDPVYKGTSLATLNMTNENISSIKIFIWNELNGMIPLAEPYIIT